MDSKIINFQCPVVTSFVCDGITKVQNLNIVRVTQW